MASTVGTGVSEAAPVRAFVVALISLPVIVVVGVLTLVSRWFGLSVNDIRQRIQDWRLTNLLKHKESDMGIDLSEFDG